MQFAHLADTHLGFRQYGLYEREEDFYSSFHQLVDKIIKERPDFVLHSGDLFEFSKPPIRALLNVQEAFMKFKESGIPVYAIAGNHDIIMRKNAIPPQKLYQDFGLKIIDLNNPYYLHGDVFIGGLPYLSKTYQSVILDQLQLLQKSSQDHNNNILMLHQSVDRYLPFDPEVNMGDLPDNFLYYAFGHIHERIIDNYGRGKLAYPGSTEIWRIDEVKGYKKNGKGCYLVDLDNSGPNIQNIDLKLPREVLKKTVEYFKLEEELSQLQKKLRDLPEKPILHLNIDGGNFDRSEVYEKINKSLGDICLSLRPNYNPETSDDDLNLSSEALNVREIIKEHLDVFGDENISRLALNMLDELAVNPQHAQKIVDKFYEAHYDH